MEGTSLTTIKFCDLPKPFFQLLVNSIDAKTRHRLRSSCRDTLCLVDEFCSVSVCIRGRDVLPKRALAYGQLSGGVRRLCIADCVKDGLFREAVCVQSAFSQLSHVVINYRLVELFGVLQHPCPCVQPQYNMCHSVCCLALLRDACMNTAPGSHRRTFLVHYCFFA